MEILAGLSAPNSDACNQSFGTFSSTKSRGPAHVLFTDRDHREPGTLLRHDRPPPAKDRALPLLHAPPAAAAAASERKRGGARLLREGI